MDTNQQMLSNLVEFISQNVSLNRRLDKKKVDTSTAKLAFTQLDKKRKGYLDLADVYSLCGDVTENDLFVVFKWLDASKTGDVSYEDFEFAVASQNLIEKRQQSDSVESVKTVVKTFLENWDYSNGSKAKLAINENSLSNFYKQICQFQRKNKLTAEDLSLVFSNSKNYDSLCRDEVKSMFKSSQLISEKFFVEAFSSFGQCDTETPEIPTLSQGKSSNYTTQCNEQQLLDEINNQYAAKKNINAKLSGQNIEDMNKFIQEKYPRNILERQNLHASTFSREQFKTLEKQAKIPERKEVDFKSGDIESLLSNIEKRREQLRKGSLERKKLIEDALSRKKTITMSNLNSTEQFELKTYSRPVSTPKNNSCSQFLINNFVDSNKTDFTKIFNRYQNEKENLTNFQSKLNEKKFEFQVKEPQWFENKGSKFMEKAYMSPQDQALDFRSCFSPQDDKRKDFFRSNESFMAQTPKFSQTAQGRFFERPLSAQKVDRFEQIREKISHLPERNPPIVQRETREIDRIIEKYKNVKPQRNQKSFNSPKVLEFNEQPQIYEQVQRNGFSALLINQSPSNLRGIENLANYQAQQRTAPESYIQDQKGRLNGSIYQYRSSTGSIQKENLLKRAEEEAARKIHEIERKAKLKVLQRKSAVGLKWVK